MNRFVCIHGHFYQPPREHPWLETVEHQESAYPFHDWNQRITAECYGPNASSRILDDQQYILRIVSNYARISFNFGPTLLAWLERARPDVYEAIIAADGASRARFGGHGSALAQAYNHSILPLCSSRDRTTQIRWGLRDFETRFGRMAKGMWLPETAVDVATLETLAEEGVEFTILAPHQAKSVRPLGRKDWIDVSGARIDPKQPYIAHLPSGASIKLFFYDGPVSQAVAFEHLLDSGDRFSDRLLGAFGPDDGPQLVHIATDGETYGHHHRHGDMALAYALHRMENDRAIELINYGAYLERFPPTAEVEIAERTSWSCAHGIERWRSDCGCNTGSKAEWRQDWRSPLREALDWLAEHLARLFEDRAAGLLKDPWAARNDYIEVILERKRETMHRFFARHGNGELDSVQQTRALKLLEMQRHAQLMYTSCGWFFDDVSGIETMQVIRYAARAIQLAQGLSDVALEGPFLERLEQAPSNVPEHENGRKIYERHAFPLRVDLPRLVAHYAVSSLFTDYQERARVFSYWVEQLRYRASTLGRSTIAVGKVRVVSEVTLESDTLAFGFVHLGDHNMSGGVRRFQGDQAFELMMDEVLGAFGRADMPEVLRLLDRHFGELTYSMRSLFRDEQRRVLDIVVDSATTDAETVSTQLYERHSPLLRYLATLDLPLPKLLRGLADFVLNTMVRAELERPELDPHRVRDLLGESEALGTDLDIAGLGYTLQGAIEEATEQWSEAPDRLGRLRRLRVAVELAQELPFEIDLSRAQNEFYALMETVLPRFADQARRGDPIALQWQEMFERLGASLRIRVRLPDESAKK